MSDTSREKGQGGVQPKEGLQGAPQNTGTDREGLEQQKTTARSEDAALNAAAPQGDAARAEAHAGENNMADHTAGSGEGATGLFGVQPKLPSVKAKLPRRAAVYDRHGEKIGKLRKGIWYDENKEQRGYFSEEGEGVLYYPLGAEAPHAYLDGNGNLLTALHTHVATLRRPHAVPFLILLIALIAATVLAIVFGAFALPLSAAPYAPTIFLTDEDGTDWNEQENLNVFYNDRFGDSVIAPGMSGSYRFIYENANDDAVEYSLGFRADNEYGILLVYRLVRDGAYLAGEEDYVGIDELGVGGLTIEAHSSAMFELQWFWAHNDPVDTVAGEEGAVYTLHIELTAAVKE